MSCPKIVPEPYLNQDALERLIHGYVFPKAKLIGGLSVDLVHSAEQMHLVKELWFQTNDRQLRHFVLCFTDKESQHIFSPEGLAYGAYRVCDYYADEYQIVFGVHQSCGRWHIHFVMNNVSFVTGKRYRDCIRNDSDFKCHIMTCLFPIDYIEIYYD